MPYASNPVFPKSQLGAGAVALPASRTPIWKNIKPPTSLAGVDTPQAPWSYPKYRYKLSLSYLRAALAYGELQTIIAFINTVAATYGVFQFDDPSDDTVSQSSPQTFGVADGVMTQYQLVRAFGGYVEPVFAVNTANIFVSDWQGNLLQSQVARTNLLLRSNTFSDAAWTSTNSTIVNSVTDPAGDTAAWTWTRSSTAAANTRQSISAAASALPYTFTIHAKAGSQYLAMNLSDNGLQGRADVVFDLTNGTISTAPSVAGASPYSNVSATITPLTGGWYRCRLTATSNNVGTVRAVFSGNSNNIKFDGTDSVSNSTVIVYGAMLEQASSGGSYIPTTSATVTRTDASISNKGLVTFGYIPQGGALLTWYGTFYWFCRFDVDEMELAQITANDPNNAYGALYTLQNLTFTTVKFGS